MRKLLTYLCALTFLSAMYALGSAIRAEPLPVIAPMPRSPEPPANPPVVLPVNLPPSQLGVLIAEPPTDLERAEVERQIDRCSRDVRAVADPWLVLALWRLEADLGVPEAARGILGATWCWEAAMREKPRAGDHGQSHGPYQMQAWHWAWCGAAGPSDDLLEAATCYWARVDDRFRARTAGCPERVRWRVAEALAANGPRYLPLGCAAESRHWQELVRWR
jgi:hypothetical protein